jgi:hypothetical protein
METVTSRIKLIINMLEYSVRSFENNIDVSNGTIQKAIANEKTVGSDVLSKILHKFPQLSAEWLMRGEGEMFRTTANGNNGSINTGVNIGMQSSTVEGDVAIHTIEHQALVDVVAFLQEELKEKNNQLKAKDELINRLMTKLDL